MGSKVGEGIHRHRFRTSLSCTLPGYKDGKKVRIPCVVFYSVRPRVQDLVTCPSHREAAKVVAITTVEALHSGV